MSVTFQLLRDVEQKLRAQDADLDAVAKEAALVEFYRQDKITHRELSAALGLHRLETDAVLKKHKVTEDLPTVEEYNAALTRLGVVTKK